ncbi:hypothetical protein [Nocardiopsis oceani]
MVHATTADQPFEVLRRTLTLLTTGPGQPALPTAAVEGIEAEELTASEILALLRHGPREVTDGLWHRVFARARAGESTWTVIAAGGALPRMVAACSRYARVPEQHIPDLESEVLIALIEQVRSIPAGVSDVGERLWSAATNTASAYAYRHARDRRRTRAWHPNRFTTAPAAGGRGPVTVLAESVATGLLTQAEADLVARTRLERAKLAQVADEMGLAYITARRWRRGAEERLENALAGSSFPM